MREKEMYPVIASEFENKYIVEYDVKLLRSSKKIIDIVCLEKGYPNKKNPELIAIEVKLKDWKRVIKQAFSRLFVADKVYIALYENAIPDSLLENNAINNNNIGIISVNDEANIIVEAKESEFTMQNRKKYIIDTMIENNSKHGD